MIEQIALGLGDETTSSRPSPGSARAVPARDHHEIGRSPQCGSETQIVGRAVMHRIAGGTYHCQQCLATRLPVISGAGIVNERYAHGNSARERAIIRVTRRRNRNRFRGTN